MPNPVVGLSPLSITTPSVPPGVLTLSVDSSVLPLVVTADTNTIAIDILVGSETVTLTDPAVVNGQHQFSGSVALSVSSSPVVFQLTGRNYTPGDAQDPNANNPLLTPTLQYQLLYMETSLAVAIQPPSGITIYKGATACVVEWALPAFTGFEGVRVQWSTDPSGITTPYTQFGDLVTSVSRSADYPTGAPSTSVSNIPGTDAAGNAIVTETTTTTQITAPVSYSSVSIPYSTVNADQFYVILTTVIQDPATNAVYESAAAGPFLCGFVNMKLVNPTDFLALQKSSDIASRMIAQITRAQPNLDLTAMAEIRDVIINPLALELANMSVREWFSRCASSISALAQIDDADGDGVSDPVATSTTKQQIARAYGLSQTDVQTFIDSRFDVIGNSQAGLARGGEETATAMAVFFTYSLPTAALTVPVNCLVSTLPNATTDAVQFMTTASGTIDPSNASAYYDQVNGWWGISLPVQCTTSGSAGNVGAGTIRQVVSNGPSGISVTNLTGATGGADQQANAPYAAMIQEKLITGVDTGSRNGYTVAALQVPGITDCLVVAAGDADMLRDWSSLVEEHTYGCVDVYTRGTSVSEQTSTFPFAYQNTSTYGDYSTYVSATLTNAASLIFSISGFPSMPFSLYSAVEFVITSLGRTVWLGVQHAQFDNTNGLIILDPTENAYVVNPDGSTSVWQINGVNATNLQMVQSVAGQASVSFCFMARYASGINYTPAIQPVLAIDQLGGPITGQIAPSNTELVYTTDFLLTGGSNEAGDSVVADQGKTVATTETVTLGSTAVTIDSAMDVPLLNNAPGNVLSVRSTDSSTLYAFGVDYSIVATAPYRTYGIVPLAGGALSAGMQVIVAYNKYVLVETLTYQTDTLTLSGTTATPLLNGGFVQNSWLPASYGNTTLLLDGWNAEQTAESGLVGAGVVAADRYIKVVYTNGQSTTVCLMGQDFSLSVDTSGNASIARISGGAIPDGASVTINYFTNEVFTLATQYPTYVQQAVNAIAATQHAAANVLVKAMVGSPVDITMVINLEDNVTPDTVDGRIRSVITILLNNADLSLAQSVLVGQVQAVSGVSSIQFPLPKCAKSDGSYSIGEVITTGTAWNPLSADTSFATVSVPSNSWITANPVLQNSTIPSGGPPNAYVGLLYEGQEYTRCLSIQQFLTSAAPSFYIIGTGDSISSALPLNSTYSGKILVRLPPNVTNPALLAFRATYQVWGMTGSQDIAVSSTEYLVPGTVNLLYNSGT